MKVTVIITTYNRASYLKEALESVLCQTFLDFELLVLDDASTDNTEDLVNSFSDSRIKYTKHLSNLGISKNRNYGLSKAQGEYIAMLDSDDLWLSRTKLEEQVNFLNAHESYGLIGTYACIIDQEKRKNAMIDSISSLFLGRSNFWMRQFFLIRNQIFHSSVLIRRKAIEEMGGYDELIPIWEDYELWLRIGTRYKMTNIPKLLTGYRVHAQNISGIDRKKGILASFYVIGKYKDSYPNYWLGFLKVWLKKNFSFL